MGGNLNQNNMNSGSNTPNGTQQLQPQAQSQTHNRPYRSPPKQPAAMAKEKQTANPQAENGEKASSKRKHDETVDETEVPRGDVSVVQSEERAYKQVKTQ